MPQVAINENVINYISEGIGPDVLLLHGWGASASSYNGVINCLKDKCRLTALDFPGCGDSYMPKEPLNIDDYADLVYEFIEKMELNNPILVGHSHGGRVIMKLCGSGRLKPKKIVFIDAAGIKPKKNLKKSIRVATYKTIRKMLSFPLWASKTEGLVQKARNHFGSADYNNAPEVMKKTLVNLVNDDMSPLIKNITASTLLIWGENDTATPLYMAKFLEQNIKDCGLCVLKNAGHWSFVEKSIEANAILRSFLP